MQGIEINPSNHSNKNSKSQLSALSFESNPSDSPGPEPFKTQIPGNHP